MKVKELISEIVRVGDALEMQLVYGLDRDIKNYALLTKNVNKVLLDSNGELNASILSRVCNESIECHKIEGRIFIIAPNAQCFSVPIILRMPFEEAAIDGGN